MRHKEQLLLSFWLQIRNLHPLKHLLDVSTYFWPIFLGPSAIQLRHIQKTMDRVKLNYTAPPAPSLIAQLLTILNESLMSLIDHNSRVNMVVWFDFCVII